MTNESNRYGDGTVFEGVRSKDSIIPTLQLATDLEGPHGMTTLLQAASELRRLHEVNQELVEALEELLKLHDNEVFVKEPWNIVMEEARAALAKARGEE